ncbi:MAG: TFIIB-type zinc ribbon-containing protein [Oscillospiraceae bacterium]|nr:TFIIB-type zinc ribbon-containing protein [Oscillospiraceae bacterium]
MSDMTFQIEIPADNDGFVLLQCPLCGDFFKVRPSDYEDDGVLSLHCPSCGQVSDNYITEDVVELAMAIAQNYATDLVYDEMKKWERQYNSKDFKFNVGQKPKHKPENPIKATIEALTISHLSCCLREAKIKPMLKICGCYCPFCGVKDYEIE